MKKIVFLTLAAFLFIGCFEKAPSTAKKRDIDNHAEWAKSEKSPSGKYRYEVFEEDRNFILHIYQDENIVFIDDQKYRMRDRFFIAWEDQKDILWVYSGDIGLYYFEEQDGQITRGACSEETPLEKIPAKIIDAVPSLRELHHPTTPDMPVA